MHEQRGIDMLTLVGLPSWFHGDSYTLVELLDRLVIEVSRFLGEDRFEFEAVAGEYYVYLDITWNGPPVPAAQLNAWLGDQRRRGFRRLKSERHPRTPSHRRVEPCRRRRKIASEAAFATGVPTARRPNRVALPPRPEFYDFELLHRPSVADKRSETLLKGLTYVAFDTETTGLKPDGGDEIVSIAGRAHCQRSHPDRREF